MERIEENKGSRQKQESYLFAWITEFCVAAPDAEGALDELERRAEEIPGDEYHHRVMTTFGATDLVEIAIFNHIYHLFQIPECTANSTSRSVGARCLTEEELERTELASEQYRQLDLADLLVEMPDRPLLAVVYLRLSAAAKLCVLPETPTLPGGTTLIDFFLGKFLRSDHPVWVEYVRMLTSTLKPLGVEIPEGDLYITSLIGLDAVDLILVVRARRLEQLAAITWAIRHQRMRSVWLADEAARGEETLIAPMLELLGQDLGTVAAEWNVSPLFKEVRCIWGLPLYPADRGPASWRFERQAAGIPPGAEAGVIVTVSKAAPDRFGDAIQSQGIMKQQGKMERARKLYGVRSVLMTFGRSDILAVPAADESLRRIEISDIQEGFSYLTGFESGDGAFKAGIWPSTEVAVRMGVPEGIAFPKYELMRRFRRLVRNRRESDLERRARGLSLTLRWLASSEERLTAYSTTNIGVSMINSLTRYLERDPEIFAELAPAVDRLIKILEEDNPTQRELLWIVAEIRDLSEFLGKQYDPLQSQDIPSSVENEVGNKISRDAFSFFARVFARSIAPDHWFFVLDAVGGGLTCELGPFRCLAFRVTPFVLHYPIAWLVAPEFAHARLASTTLGDLPNLLIKQDLFRLSNEVGDYRFVDSSGETLKEMFDRLGEAVRSCCEHSLAQIFARALKSVLSEVISDFVLWRSVRLGEESPVDTGRKFWLIHGPGLVSATQFFYGAMAPSMAVVNSLVLRVFFMNFLLHVREVQDTNASDGWGELLCEVLDELAKPKNQAFALAEHPLVYGLGHLERSYVYLQCLKLDLRIPEVKWLTAIGLLRRGVALLLRERSEVGGMIGGWVRSVEPLVDCLFEPRAMGDLARKWYCGYLAELADSWPTADPWPPFIEHHSIEVVGEGEDVSNRSVPEGRLRESDPEGGFISLRGGVYVRDKGGGLAGQKRYHRATGLLIKRLADHCRKIRFQELREFVRG